MVSLFGCPIAAYQYSVIDLRTEEFIRDIEILDL